jgi:hypothetical protein
MFLMMNAARLHVALQGLGHLEMAAQNAARYAAGRVQFKAPIDRHPATQRTLLRLRAVADGLRVVMYRAAMRLDEAAQHPDAAVRTAASAEASLLTPVLKAFGSQQGFLGASDALQVWGGYGYVADYGIEQTLRDARIAMIYEGTNEIQAIDLVQRKLLGGAGPAFDTLLDGLLRDAGDDACGTALRGQVAQVREALGALQAAAAADATAALRVADEVLAGCGHLLLAWSWAAIWRAADRDDPADRARRAAALHGVRWVLPQAGVHWERVRMLSVAAAA